jgi:chromosome segregation ATPase
MIRTKAVSNRTGVLILLSGSRKGANQMVPGMKMRVFFFLLTSIFLLQGCGYSLKMVDDEAQRLETRNKKELEAAVARLQSEVKQIKEEGRQTTSSVQKKRADLEVRLDEVALQIRMIQGNIEKEGHRIKELSHQVENIAFRVNELGEIKNRLSEQEKKWNSVQKTLQEQIDSIKVAGSTLQKSSEEQAKKMEALSAQVSELSEKIPPALNAQAVQLNDLGLQFEKMTKGADAEEVNKTLVELSNALNVLGQKITSKVDEQEKLLQKATKRLQALEAKLASGKRSSFSEAEGERPLFSEIYYELGAGYYELNELQRAQDAFARAREISGAATIGFDRILPVQEGGID